MRSVLQKPSYFREFSLFLFSNQRSLLFARFVGLGGRSKNIQYHKGFFSQRQSRVKCRQRKKDTQYYFLGIIQYFFDGHPRAAMHKMLLLFFWKCLVFRFCNENLQDWLSVSHFVKLLQKSGLHFRNTNWQLPHYKHNLFDHKKYGQKTSQQYQLFIGTCILGKVLHKTLEWVYKIHIFLPMPIAQKL